MAQVQTNEDQPDTKKRKVDQREAWMQGSESVAKQQEPCTTKGSWVAPGGVRPPHRPYRGRGAWSRGRGAGTPTTDMAATKLLSCNFWKGF
jgi:hypothetical protein